MPSHIDFMARAIQLAKQGLYSTDPNPRVGCVLVKEGNIIGEGYHVRAGEGHAEVNALAQAGSAAQGATAYVTLEPCSHFGRTPPCSDTLIKAGIRTLVCAMQDPNPEVSGRGFEKMRAAGIEIISGVLESEAKKLNPGFIKRMSGGLPYVRVKIASSLDGRTAMASGESQWITGGNARADVQRLRARSSAIISGIDSILADDSSLTVREDELALADAELAKRAIEKQPLRVILDSHGRIRPDHKVVNQSGQTLVCVRHGVQLPNFVESLALNHGESGLNLRELLKALADRQCNEVLVETGSTLAGQFIQQGLVDEVVHYMAPCLMGSEARPVFAMDIETMADKIPVQISDVRHFGNDIRFTYTLQSQNKD
ncbi:bifunctional diaminohydroxyphosphoribosylaminopyrimidine deaminase/5-amino-6-(5-phosphoribosylamino)uracil reductase RibD [Bermanella marisrubri]|uniref:Riboflavin biosynthesis protein RibD n=1 Tax=Bermanella marisrubri TaxID=207949 RepID=Q1N2N5_9GAMM|nr:bifunctional diaminohydroxyphosphoribosylaminopyrimidine deaminase/5-amino-6-(5-phosphoribosylamino)uracil reductase RibD [Bermanella marisrubri]EAT12372.1 riboflavin-specific deaminase/reductase [Oceanobacter sp. RED65] [Bermanella marisrubri]QIZ85455.1 bifunctional diaminohydroxyphosphoribosylaminopyrimidine deaminase/5-amino-6-(5-phosphoribosylamino)uracil reductase RibD [Bermanella marisrubri]